MASESPAVHPHEAWPRRLNAQQAADYLGVPLKFFYQVVRWEIAVYKTTPGRNGKIIVEVSELDRWLALHREVPAVGYREEPRTTPKRQRGARAR